MTTPILLRKEAELLEKIPYTLAQRLENRLEDVVSFSGTHQNYCVGIVDMVGSTKVSAHLTKEQMTQYYGLFLNGMAMIAKDHGAIVVKSIGDSLLYYFPKTLDYKPEHFVCPLKSAVSMVECSDIINAKTGIITCDIKCESLYKLTDEFDFDRNINFGNSYIIYLYL